MFLNEEPGVFITSKAWWEMPGFLLLVVERRNAGRAVWRDFGMDGA